MNNWKVWLENFKAKPYSILGLLILVALPITLILVKQTQDSRSSAAEADKLETEGGTLSSTGATKVSDSGASGGQYVVFANQTSSPTPTPQSSSPTPLSGLKYPPNQTGVTYIAVPSLALPGYLQEVKDPTFAGSITRISNTDGYRNAYAKKSAWNSDGTRAAFFGYGDRLIDGNTYQDLGSISGAPGRATWSYVDPNIVWGTHNSDNRLKKYNVSTKTTTYRAFSGYSDINNGSGEGNISDDDRYIGLLGTTTGGVLHAIHFDIVADQILYTAVLPIKPDWLGVSHTGRYLVVAYADDGSGPTQGYKIYDRLSSNPSQPRHLANKTSHSDFARMEDGTEVHVHIDGDIKAVRLSDGQSWTILSGGNLGFGHVSGRAIDRWGWIYLSGNIYTNLGNRGHDQLAAVKLDGSQTVQVFSHARTVQPRDQYVYGESTHAVPNRDGTKIMWGGRWNDTGGMYSYVVRVK